MSIFGKVLGIGASIAGAVTGQPWLSALGEVGSNMMDNSAKAAISNKSNALSLYMSNTAHQREVADLKAAGLNPILSAGGQGASTPPVSTPSYTDTAGVVSRGASSALDNKIKLEQLNNLKQDTEVKRQTASKVNFDAQNVIFDSALKQLQARAMDYDNVSKAAEAEIMSGASGTLIKGLEKLGIGADSITRVTKMLPLKGKKSLKGKK